MRRFVEEVDHAKAMHSLTILRCDFAVLGVELIKGSFRLRDRTPYIELDLLYPGLRSLEIQEMPLCIFVRRKRVKSSQW